MRRSIDRVAATLGDSMSNTRKSWTYYKGCWHEGDVRILGASSQSTWLGSLVFDGARGFEGVYPDLDRHAARVNDSARTLGLKPTMTGEAIAGLAKGRAEEIRCGCGGLYPADVLGETRDTGFILPLPESPISRCAWRRSTDGGAEWLLTICHVSYRRLTWMSCR
jgi:hypothetical protein